MLIQDPLAGRVIGCAMEVHRAVGPGLLESTYRACMAEELRCTGIPFEAEVPVSLRYRSIAIERAYRLDLLVDKQLVVELKSVERLMPIHTAQVITYLQLTGHRLGLLINFAVPVLREGIRAVFPRTTVPIGPRAS